MKLGYYPGCSQENSPEYGESLAAIAPLLDLELVEPDDWNCCGASSAHATNFDLAIALPARNLALAEDQGLSELMAPCAACYNRLIMARHALAEQPELLARMPDILDRPISNSVEVQSILQCLLGLTDLIKERAVRPLTGVRVVCYYGCLLVRPPNVVRFDDPEQPSSMEEVVAACGAEPVDWPMRVECCGAGYSLARTQSVLRLGRMILKEARRAGADAIAVACPMCHSNLDFRQEQMTKQGEDPLPVLYVTQLIGLALGLWESELGFKRHFVDVSPLLHKIAGGATAARSTPKGGA